MNQKIPEPRTVLIIIIVIVIIGCFIILLKNVRRTVKGKEMTKKLDYVPVVMISWEGREEC